MACIEEKAWFDNGDGDRSDVGIDQNVGSSPKLSKTRQILLQSIGKEYGPASALI